MDTSSILSRRAARAFLAMPLAFGLALCAGAPGARAAEPAPVTWSDVQRNPDDVALNLRFARQQIRQGDHLSAAATLERLLLVAPGNLTVRVLYAVTLYRLDSLDEAKRQIDFLLAQPLPDRLRKELTLYQSDLARRLRRTTAQLLVHSAVRVDTNPNRLPSDTNVLTATGPLPLTGSETDDADVALTGYGKLSIEHDLGLPQRRVLFAAIGWYQTEYLRATRASQLGVVAEAGAWLQFGAWELTPRLSGAWSNLSHQPFVRSLEARLTVARDLDRTTRVEAFLAAGPHLYDGLSEAPDQHLRTGPVYLGGVRLERRLNRRMRLFAGAQLIRRSAVADHYSATGYRLFADHEWRLRSGVFVLSHLSWQLDDYDGRNPADFGTGDRRDQIVRASSLVGVPMLTLAPGLPRHFDRTALSFQVEYTTSLSNIDRYTNDNWRFVLAITKRFDL